MRKYPIGGYAPGEYIAKCKSCAKEMDFVDKLASQCEVCALWCEVTRLREQLRADIKNERERIAAWIEPQRCDVPATGLEFAAAIRSLGDAEENKPSRISTSVKPRNASQRN